MKNKKIKVFIADDHKLFRSGIIEIINSSDIAEVVGEVENGAELVERFSEVQADLLLVDISMPVMSGIEAVQKICKIDNGVKALFLSMYDSEEYIYAALISGGLGLINKDIDKDELFEAIEKVNNGVKYFKNLNSKELDNILDRFAQSKPVIALNLEDLTKREKKILKFISEGLTSAEIAQKLNLSKRTVDSHRTNLIHKLNLRSLPDLIKFSIQFYQLKNQV